MHKEQLGKITNARNDLYQIDFATIALIAAVLVSGALVPFMAPVFGLILFGFMYYKLVKVARMPCPRCGKPFGTRAKFVFGVGGDSCEACELPINSE